MEIENYMRLALRLAVKGMGFVSPNPMVGAIVVKDGVILGSGWHKKYGGLHAEREAFADCDAKGADCSGADMYVTLEPCCHRGKQPPCAEAIVERGIKRVFVGSADPNPLVAGKGISFLRERGIEVVENVLREECNAINEIFFKYIVTKKPLVTMKYAMTADGKIACRTGESKWITGEEARLNVHRDRLKYSAVMVGVGTVLSDDPQLTCRIEGGRDPYRIICDSSLRTPLSSNIVRAAKDIPTIIATARPSDRASEYESRGCKIVCCGEDENGRVDLRALVEKLGELGIDSVILEGGASLNWAALKAGVVDKVQTYIAPKIFGGAEAKTPVGGLGVRLPSEAFILEGGVFSRFGEDIMIESRVKYVHGNS